MCTLLYCTLFHSLHVITLYIITFPYIITLFVHYNISITESSIEPCIRHRDVKKRRVNCFDTKRGQGLYLWCPCVATGLLPPITPMLTRVENRQCQDILFNVGGMDWDWHIVLLIDRWPGMTKTYCLTAYSVWQDKVRAYRVFKRLAGNDESRSRWRVNKASYLAEEGLRLGKCACYAETNLPWPCIVQLNPV